MHRIVIFASGTGSNALRLIEYFKGHTTVEIALIVSNKADAKVLDIAAAHGIPSVVIKRKDFYETTELLDTFQRHGITFIVLAGFLWLIPAWLVAAFDRKMINIHPALLPQFGGKGMFGMHVHEAVKAAGVAETGITIHFVNAHYDEGDIISQERCPVLPTDTPAHIAQKVQQLEHQHLPKVVDIMLHGKNL
jgi:phosphoribosylglycinamide formyltransferase 1